LLGCSSLKEKKKKQSTNKGKVKSCRQNQIPLAYSWVEEQEIYRELYNSILPRHANIEVMRVSGGGEKGSMMRAVTELTPNVMLLSVKKLDKV